MSHWYEESDREIRKLKARIAVLEAERDRWKRIQAGSKRDPERPYCREPETCGGSCRRDPACCE